jgi:hypothetical protein
VVQGVPQLVLGVHLRQQGVGISREQ